ncbi:SsgA family sporulation/cell division regulator [Streptomyces endophyticus]|uniref:SsgA family sporulation/cell division regulator n=1 Tax=Streptomyces endophyticus TaxID=714166 RepID=A0ABU6F5Y6_9ACTN|nr:SsgA family sporulation/cell division regulator [Streptomyces endophyticus]MEB8339062.1 SsgA family sporulation/cell division regulator [Streptomyces endophyticus]
MSPDERHTHGRLEALATGVLAYPDGERFACEVELRYSADDPLVVRVVVPGSVARGGNWTLSRDLLSAGLSGAAGVGDVTVRPVVQEGEPLGVEIEIRGTRVGGPVRFVMGHRALLTYLERSHALVPFGAEADQGAMDRELEQFLDERDRPGETGNA